MRFRLLAAISLALNLFLIVVLFSGRQREDRLEQDALGAAPASPAAREAEPAVPGLETDGGALVGALAMGDVASWEALHSDDFKVFVAKLRKAGFPGSVSADIVVGEVERSMRAKAALADAPDMEWWKPGADEVLARRADAASDALKADRDALLTDLLGADWEAARSESGLVPRVTALPGLGPERARAVLAAEEEFETSLAKLRRESMAAGREADEAEVARLREAKRLALDRILNDRQLEGYQLRHSELAKSMRRELVDFNATSNEFLTIFRICEPVEREIALECSGGDEASAPKRKDLERKRDGELMQALGKDRFQEYRFNRDPLYRSARAFASKVGATGSAVLSLYEISGMGMAERNRIEQDEELDELARRAALMETRRKFDGYLQQILAGEAMKKYRASGLDFLDTLPR